MPLQPSGNVFCDPDNPGVRLNEGNVRDMKNRQVTRFGTTDPDAPRGPVASPPSNSYGMTEVDEEGHQPPSVEAQQMANVQETLSSISGLRSQQRQGNRAADAMLRTLAATERSMPGGGRQTVLREFQKMGI